MYELNFIIDIVEERLVKGNLRWLANFNEVQRDYTINDVVFPIYASGSLQERGFFLSRIFSTFVTPKYKIHFLLQTSEGFDPKFLRKLILLCKDKFTEDDWVFLCLVQSRPFDRSAKESIASHADKNIGVAAFSLASKEAVTSNNVLGRGLEKQLKLTEAKFESFDVPNFLKSFTVVFGLGMLLLVVMRLSGVQEAVQPLTILLMIAFSLIIGHRIYKTRYHTTLSLSSKGFQLQEGKKITEGKWSDYANVTMFITPGLETCLRLRAKKETLDLPLSRVGLSRKETFDAIRQLVKKRQRVTQ